MKHCCRLHPLSPGTVGLPYPFCLQNSWKGPLGSNWMYDSNSFPCTSLEPGLPTSRKGSRVQNDPSPRRNYAGCLTTYPKAEDGNPRTDMQRISSTHSSCCRQQCITEGAADWFHTPSTPPLTRGEFPLEWPQCPGKPWAATSKPRLVTALRVRGHGGSVQQSHRPRLPGAPPTLGAGRAGAGTASSCHYRTAEKAPLPLRALPFHLTFSAQLECGWTSSSPWQCHQI
ncbi:uncharacterized protein LOC117287385 [Fukomys damarensis]|uniref:uncharacterized protein LOC117287385 n=1 Tax=Fukomys damarensis TaxID=885580 RepID=UPI0014557BF9|nr:uncharacterized protein LOC117287385 [Fukomys damarensis]